MTEFIITCKSELKPDGSYQIERYRELVRCKDCKHRNESNSPYWEIWCERNDRSVDGDWFCADGDRGDEA